MQHPHNQNSTRLRKIEHNMSAYLKPSQAGMNRIT
jgi:hypothetical protein